MSTFIVNFVLICTVLMSTNGNEETQIAVTNPTSDVAYGGTSHVFECTVPDSTPIGDDHHEIFWLYKGPADSDAMPMVGNGDVFNEDNERIIDGTVNTDYSDATKITSTLTIEKVTAEAAGEYNCALRWGRVFLESTPASLTVRTITSPPRPTNVAKGAEAEFTCKTVADSEATINIHVSSGREATGWVDVDTVEGVVTTTDFMILFNVTESSICFCKARWGENVVRSADVSVSVLDVTSSTTTVWGVVGKVAEFGCSADVLLKTNGQPYLVNGEKVFATTLVTWEFFDTADSTWKSSDTKSRFVMRTPLTSTGGIRTFSLSLLNVQDTDDGLKVRCNIAYQTDLNFSLYGGTVSSGDLTVKLAQITSFTASNPSPTVGEIITLSCSATGNTVPDFQFWIGMRSSFNNPYLEIVESKTVSQAENTYTATLKVKAILANNLRNGESLTCRADFGGAQIEEEGLVVTNYFDCSTVPVRSYNLEDNGATITQTDLGGGSLKQTISCPADTSTTKYKLFTQANSGEEITCTRETGKYEPAFLAICQETRAFSSGTGMQKMTIPTSAEKPAPCTSEATGEWSISVMKQKLNSLTDTNCGFRHAVSCLKSGECTLDTTRSGCRYESGKIIMEYFVNFNSPVWTLVQRDGLVQLGGRVKFWSCSGTYG